eukprot:92177_1
MSGACGGGVCWRKCPLWVLELEEEEITEKTVLYCNLCYISYICFLHTGTAKRRGAIKEDTKRAAKDLQRATTRPKNQNKNHRQKKKEHHQKHEKKKKRCSKDRRKRKDHQNHPKQKLPIVFMMCLCLCLFADLVVSNANLRYFNTRSD